MAVTPSMTFNDLIRVLYLKAASPTEGIPQPMLSSVTEFSSAHFPSAAYVSSAAPVMRPTVPPSA